MSEIYCENCGDFKNGDEVDSDFGQCPDCAAPLKSMYDILDPMDFEKEQDALENDND